jgi:hypothetical protein
MRNYDDETFYKIFLRDRFLQFLMVVAIVALIGAMYYGYQYYKS